jgi:hypothetical protein
VSLNAARTDLMDALTAASIDTFYGWGAFSAPCVRIFPGEPWVGTEGLLSGKRSQRWEVWAVAGRVDAGATFDDMEALVQSVHNALEPLQRWSHLEWRRPAIVDMSGARYLACRGVIETFLEV